MKHQSIWVSLVSLVIASSIGGNDVVVVVRGEEDQVDFSAIGDLAGENDNSNAMGDSVEDGAVEGTASMEDGTAPVPVAAVGGVDEPDVISRCFPEGADADFMDYGEPSFSADLENAKTPLPAFDLTMSFVPPCTDVRVQDAQLEAMTEQIQRTVTTMFQRCFNTAGMGQFASLQLSTPGVRLLPQAPAASTQPAAPVVPPTQALQGRTRAERQRNRVKRANVETRSLSHHIPSSPRHDGSRRLQPNPARLYLQLAFPEGGEARFQYSSPPPVPYLQAVLTELLSDPLQLAQLQRRIVQQIEASQAVGVCPDPSLDAFATLNVESALASSATAAVGTVPATPPTFPGTTATGPSDKDGFDYKDDVDVDAGPDPEFSDMLQDALPQNPRDPATNSGPPPEESTTPPVDPLSSSEPIGPTPVSIPPASEPDPWYSSTAFIAGMTVLSAFVVGGVLLAGFVLRPAARNGNNAHYASQSPRRHPMGKMNYDYAHDLEGDGLGIVPPPCAFSPNNDFGPYGNNGGDDDAHSISDSTLSSRRTSPIQAFEDNNNNVLQLPDNMKPKEPEKSLLSLLSDDDDDDEYEENARTPTSPFGNGGGERIERKSPASASSKKSTPAVAAVSTFGGESSVNGYSQGEVATAAAATAAAVETRRLVRPQQKAPEPTPDPKTNSVVEGDLLNINNDASPPAVATTSTSTSTAVATTSTAAAAAVASPRSNSVNDPHDADFIGQYLASNDAAVIMGAASPGCDPKEDAPSPPVHSSRAGPGKQVPMKPAATSAANARNVSLDDYDVCAKTIDSSTGSSYSFHDARSPAGRGSNGARHMDARQAPMAPLVDAPRRLASSSSRGRSGIESSGSSTASSSSSSSTASSYSRQSRSTRSSSGGGSSVSSGRSKNSREWLNISSAIPEGMEAKAELHDDAASVVSSKSSRSSHSRRWQNISSAIPGRQGSANGNSNSNNGGKAKQDSFGSNGRIELVDHHISLTSWGSDSDGTSPGGASDRRLVSSRGDERKSGGTHLKNMERLPRIDASNSADEASSLSDSQANVEPDAGSPKMATGSLKYLQALSPPNRSSNLYGGSGNDGYRPGVGGGRDPNASMSSTNSVDDRSMSTSKTELLMGLSPSMQRSASPSKTNAELDALRKVGLVKRRHMPSNSDRSIEVSDVVDDKSAPDSPSSRDGGKGGLPRSIEDQAYGRMIRARRSRR